MIALKLNVVEETLQIMRGFSSRHYTNILTLVFPKLLTLEVVLG